MKVVGFEVGMIFFPIGREEHLCSFFHSVHQRLEIQWGTKYPKIMNGLFSGELKYQEAPQALKELGAIKESYFTAAVGDFCHGLQKRLRGAPWQGRFLREHPFSLDFHLSPKSREIIQSLEDALKESMTFQENIQISSI